MKTKLSVSSLVTLVTLFAGCSPDSADKGQFDFDSHLGAGGKADMLSSAHVVRQADLNARFSGDFDPRVRVYGFSVQAKTGAVLHVDMLTAAGDDSFDVDTGEELDTVIAVYGPMKGDKPGPLVAHVDDDDSGLAAQLPALEIEDEGEYLVVLSSWNDPGHGSYTMDLQCEGTDFQCRAPVKDVPCVDGTEYILGGQSVATTTWDRCNYVLLEETHVEPDAILTVNPGVKVQGNFLGQAPWGDVRLVVDGTVQAVGTKEHPVLFTSLQDEGWGGVVLSGRSTLKNVFVENAEIGVEVVGNDNLLEDIDINTSNTGVFFRGQTDGHRIVRGRIAKVTNGIDMEQTVVNIEDTVILGNGTVTGVGVRGTDTTASHFERALVAGFGTGIDLDSAELEMVDATITGNTRGVHVTGEDPGLDPGYTCPPQPNFVIPAPRSWPAPPTTWRRDPVFRRVDLIGNAEYAVRIDAPELLVIEDSNVRNNGAGIIIGSGSLHSDSRINGSNIFDNGNGLMQVETFHNDGVLDISGNYWAQISDPDLSESWREDHDDYLLPASEVECNVSRFGTPSGCTTVGNSNTRQCGDYLCSRNGSNWNCQVNRSVLADPWSGEVRFTGFSPIRLAAGPDEATLGDGVKQERTEQGI